MTTKYQCPNTKCSWEGNEDEVDFARDHEGFEFWGQRGVRTVVTPICPDCGTEVEPVENLEDEAAPKENDKND